MDKKTKNLEQRIAKWKEQGKQEKEITYGMLLDGFQSISGIPDNFYSAEDPSDRVSLWNQYKENLNKPRSHCGSNCGECSLCDPTYKD